MKFLVFLPFTTASLNDLMKQAAFKQGVKFKELITEFSSEMLYLSLKSTKIINFYASVGPILLPFLSSLELELELVLELSSASISFSLPNFVKNSGVVSRSHFLFKC